MIEIHVEIALKNYHQFKREIVRIENKIEELNARKYKAGGSIAKCPENPIDRSTIIINNLGKGECLEEELSLCRYYVNLAEGFISVLPEPEKSIVRDRFIARKTMAYVCDRYFMDRTTVWRRINKSIQKFIEIT